MHMIEFWVFFTLTSFRQIHYYWHQTQQRKIHNNKDIVIRKDRIGSALIAYLYTIIVLGTILELYLNTQSIYWYSSGVSLVFLGVIIRVIGVNNLGKNYAHDVRIWKNHRYVSTGIYKWIRHPLYTGMAMEAIGMVLLTQMIWLFVVCLLLITVLIRCTFVENKVLKELQLSSQ